MSDSAVFTTAMSSMSMAVAAQTTARVQRWVVVKWCSERSWGSGGMLPARGREHIRGFPSQTVVLAEPFPQAAASTAAWTAGLRPASTPPSTGRVVPVIQRRVGAGEEEDRLDDVGGLAAAAERVEAVDRVEHLLRLARAS